MDCLNRQHWYLSLHCKDIHKQCGARWRYRKIKGNSYSFRHPSRKLFSDCRFHFFYFRKLQTINFSKQNTCLCIYKAHPTSAFVLSFFQVRYIKKKAESNSVNRQIDNSQFHVVFTKQHGGWIQVSKTERKGRTVVNCVFVVLV